MNGRKRRNAPITKTASPVNLSTVHATTTPATANARPMTARNARAGSTTDETEEFVKGVSRPTPT